MTINKKTKVLLASASAFAVLTAAPAYAQVNDEIIVTATKRAESIQDVPIAVTALNGSALEIRGITDITSLDASTPGLSFGQSGSDARPAIRGARTESVNERQDPVIGMFVDGVYQARSSQALASFYDVQQVEVLRGPQGTLFGRNTFGGAIHVKTNKPDFGELDYMASGEVGSFERTRFEGMVNVPLAENLALRVAGFSDRSDGYITNLQDPNTNLGQTDADGWRASLGFEPNDVVSGVARVSGWNTYGIGGGDFGYTVLGTLRDPDGVSSLNGSLDPINPRSGSGGTLQDPGPYEVYRDFPLTRNGDAFNASLDLNADLEGLTLRSITSYQDFDIYRQNDSDFSPAPGNYSSVETAAETFSQEFQVLSNGSGPLEWIVGAFYLQDETLEDFIFETLCTTGPGPNPRVSSCVAPSTSLGNIAFAARGVVDTKSYAIFGQGTYQLNDRLGVTAGLRYSNDEKDFDRFDLDVLLNTGNTVQIVDESASFDKLTYKFGLDYEWSDDSLVYASVSNGFNSGGFNTSGAELSFGPQTVTAFEVGAKNTLLDGAMTLNLAAYYNDYKDLLSQGFISTPPTVSVFSTNAGEARTMGIEVEADWEVADDTFLTAALALTDGELGDFVVGNPFVRGGQNVNGGGNNLQLDGSDIALTPDFTATITGRKRFDIGELGSLTPFVQFAYNSGYFTNDVNFTGSKQDAFTKTNARLTWDSDNDRLSVAAFVNNIENEAVLNRTVVGGQDAIFANYAQPRSFGLKLTVRR